VSETSPIPGQLDVDEVLELVEHEQRQGEPAGEPGASGELVSALEPLIAAWVATLADAPQTQRTYRQAAGRFLAWLGPQATPDALTLHTMAAYQAHLAAPGPDGKRRSSATIRKERAALNALLRWAIDHNLVDRQQGALATSVRLPKAQTTGDEPPKALDDAQYARLIAVVTAQAARDRLIGARDLAIVRTLATPACAARNSPRSSAATFCPPAKAPTCASCTYALAKAIANARSSSPPPPPRRSSRGNASAPEPSGRPPRTIGCSSPWAAGDATAPTPNPASRSAPSCSPTCSSATGATPPSPRTYTTPTSCATPWRPAGDAAAATSRRCAASSATPA